jgi:hypothetical protein
LTAAKDGNIVYRFHGSVEPLLLKGRYASFSYPGAAATTAYGINALGQVVGAYTYDFESYHGFIAKELAAHDPIIN